MYDFSASLVENVLLFCPLQSTVTMDGDKLVHVQKWDGKETKFVREIKDGKMVMVRTDADHTCLLFTNKVEHMLPPDYK